MRITKTEDLLAYRALLVPEFAKVITGPGVPFQVTTWEENGKFYAKAWIGKSMKPYFFYSYKNEESRTISVDRFIKDQTETFARRNAYKAEQKAARMTPHTLAVGSILVCSWGHEQTNVDFYEVTGVVGKNTIVVRKLATNVEPSGDMSGYVTPRKGEYVGEHQRFRATGRNTFKPASYAVAVLWDGRPCYESHYA